MAPEDDIGARVRAARSYAGLSQQQLAAELGVERRQLMAIEAGNGPHELTIPQAKRIADICGVPLPFLVGGWEATRTIEDHLGTLERDVAQLVGLLTDNPESGADLQANILKLFEDAMRQRAREVGRQTRRPAKRPRAPKKQPAA